MPTVNEWRGDSQEVAQVDTLTVAGTPAAANKIRVTINRKYVEYTFVTADTTALMAAGLYALLNASEIAEFREVTWTYPGTGSVITCTAATPGKPFTQTASATGGGATLTKGSVTASLGPNHADDPANWTLGTLPANTEQIVIRRGADILYGIATAFAKDFDSVLVYSSFTGNFGLPFLNDEYVEYRPRYAVFGDTAGCRFDIGIGDGSGSGLMLLDLYGGDVVNVYDTATRQDTGLASLNFIVRNGTATVLNVSGGDVAFCGETGQAGTLATVRVITGRFTQGEGATVTALDQDSGTVDAFGIVTAATQTAGLYTQWDGTLTSVISEGGTVVMRHTGTVAVATFRGQGGGLNVATCDCSQDPRARTFTASTFTGGGRLLDPNFTVTLTAAATFDKASLAASDMGSRFALQRT